MFAVVANEYSRDPLTAQADRVGAAEARYAAGEIGKAALAAEYDDYVREVLREQELAGMSMVGDGGVRWFDTLAPLVAGLAGLKPGLAVLSVDSGLPVTRPAVGGPIRWRYPIYVAAYEFARGCTGVPLKQVVPGPYSVGRMTLLEGAARRKATLELADALNEELRQLALAGCLVVQVEEDGAALIGEAAAERALFVDAHRRLTAGFESPELVHLSLAVAGGTAADAGAATIFEAPYSSYFFDVVRGHRNWELILQAPADRGIVCGVANAQSTRMDDLEAIVYAIAYAAGANNRGATRVGIAPSGSLRAMPHHYARRKLERLAVAIGLAGAGPIAEVATALEPNPATTRRYPDLRKLAEGYMAARARIGLDPLSW